MPSTGEAWLSKVPPITFLLHLLSKTSRRLAFHFSLAVLSPVCYVLLGKSVPEEQFCSSGYISSGNSFTTMKNRKNSIEPTVT